LSIALHASLVMLFDGVPGRSGGVPPGSPLVVTLPRLAERPPESGRSVTSEMLQDAGGSARPEAVAPPQGGSVADASDGAAAIAGLPVERYRASRDLDVQPQAYFVPSLDSAEMAGTTGYQRVELKLWVSDAGIVDDAEVLSGSPVFSETVRRAFLGARFTPGMLGGKPVPAVVTFEVEYPEIR
jgi:hypothetical protein